MYKNASKVCNSAFLIRTGICKVHVCHLWNSCFYATYRVYTKERCGVNSFHYWNRTILLCIPVYWYYMELNLEWSFGYVRLDFYKVYWLSCGLHDLGFDSWQGQEIFLVSETSRVALQSTQLPTQWVPRVMCVTIWGQNALSLLWEQVNKVWHTMQYLLQGPVCEHGGGTALNCRANGVSLASSVNYTSWAGWRFNAPSPDAELSPELCLLWNRKLRCEESTAARNVAIRKALKDLLVTEVPSISLQCPQIAMSVALKFIFKAL
jgi:hypothetical protein